MVQKFNNWIGLMQCKTLTPTEKVTIGNILVFNNAKDMGYWNNIPLTLLAENVNISTRGLSKVVKKLEDKGIITKKQKTYRNANDYVPNIEAINNLIETLNKEQSSDKGNGLNKEQSSDKSKEQSSDKGNGLNKEQSSDKSKEQSSDKYKIKKTNNYNLISYNLTADNTIDGVLYGPIPQESNLTPKNTVSSNETADSPTDGVLCGSMQDEANLNSNERTCGNPNEDLVSLDLRDLGLSYCDEYHNTIRQTDTMQDEDRQTPYNSNEATHNTNKHNNGNPNEGYIASLEAEMAMQYETMRTEGITQPIVDIDQTPYIPIEPNEDILQQAYEWFNGEGDYDPINLPNEEPIAPKNASEGLKDPRVDNYTQSSLDALKTAENPQKSKPTTESMDARDNNTPQNGDKTPKNAPTSAQNFQWIIQPTQGRDWRSVKIAIENLRPSEVRTTKSLQALIDGVYNKYRVIETLQMTKEHCMAWYQRANFHVVANVYWRAMLWYLDPNNGYTKDQTKLVYTLLSDITKLIKGYDNSKVSNTVYMAFKSAGYKLKPTLIKPKIAA